MPGGRIDTDRAFIALGIAVLTISNRNIDVIISNGDTGLDSRHRPCAIVELLRGRR
jgi:hypothetical protein